METIWDESASLEVSEAGNTATTVGRTLPMALVIVS